MENWIYIVCLIIEYAYMHSVSITAENVEGLLVAANQFCILDLVRVCLALMHTEYDEVAPPLSRRCYINVVVMDGSTAERFKPETNAWTHIAPMAKQRSEAGAATLHDKVIEMGSKTRHNQLKTG
ncbi:hypothetical protein UPYG_G00324440 [Umbra pygmaea]|uniref:BTB domain-containing protein n=1 Tax=Umbra pygmaea TaxID=75934 RepID=A0ABD0WPF2_UMBPY